MSLSFTIKSCVDLTKSHREHRTIQRHHWSRSTWLKNPNLRHMRSCSCIIKETHERNTHCTPVPPPLFSSPTCPTVRPHQYPDPCYPPPPAVGVDLLWCNYYLLLVEPGFRNSRKVNQFRLWVGVQTCRQINRMKRDSSQQHTAPRLTDELLDIPNKAEGWGGKRRGRCPQRKNKHRSSYWAVWPPDSAVSPRDQGADGWTDPPKLLFQLSDQLFIQTCTACATKQWGHLYHRGGGWDLN